MPLGILIPLSIRSLLLNKARTGLTMLGVIIGVGVVITLLAIAEGQRFETLEMFRRMGTNVLFVMPSWGRMGRVRGEMGSGFELNLDDLEAVRRTRYVKRASPQLMVSASIKYLNENLRTNVVGTDNDSLQIQNYETDEGRLFNEEELKGRGRVTIIGSTVREELFKNLNPIGKAVKINGKQFLVVGTLKEKGAFRGSNPDDRTYIPIMTAMRSLGNTRNISNIVVEISSSALGKEAEEQITRTIKRLHPPTNPEDDVVRIWNAAEFQEERDRAAKVISLFLIAVGALSLLIGGIGIMNIMLVTVSERTREIGIRKALGATRSSILVQFLTEAVIMCIVGGTLGILLGYTGSALLGRLPETVPFPKPLVTTSSLLVAFFVSFGVGIVFGSWPAYLAALLDPIQSLRSE